RCWVPSAANSAPSRRSCANPSSTSVSSSCCETPLARFLAGRGEALAKPLLEHALLVHERIVLRVARAEGAQVIGVAQAFLARLAGMAVALHAIAEIHARRVRLAVHDAHFGG